MSLPSQHYNQTHLQFKCLPQSGIPSSSHVTLAVRSLHCCRHHLSHNKYRPSSDTFINALFEARERIPRNDLEKTNVSAMIYHRSNLDDTSRFGKQYRILVTLTGAGGLLFHSTPMSTITSSILQPETINVEWKQKKYGENQNLRKGVAPSVTCSYSCTWDDSLDQNILVLPVRYKDLTRDTSVFLQLLESGGEVGGATEIASAEMLLWDVKGVLKMGLQKLKLNLVNSPANQSTLKEEDKIEDEKWDASLILDQMENLNQASVQCRNDTTKNATDLKNLIVNKEQDIQLSREPVPWLDKLTKKYCIDLLDDTHIPSNNQQEQHEVKIKSKSNAMPSVLFQQHLNIQNEDQNDIFLVVELPTCAVPIVHQEVLYTSGLHGASGSVTAMDLSQYHHNEQRRLQAKKSSLNSDRHDVRSSEELTFSLADTYSLPMPNAVNSMQNNRSQDIEDDQVKIGIELVQILDHESEEDNPVEDKYRTLQHELLRGLVDPALKPDAEERGRLNAIIGGTSQHLSREEKDLLWRFRFSLVDNSRALTKFLLAVEWTVESEVVQAAELLDQWRERSPIEVTDALKLLGKNVAFQTGLVRAYAIETLAAASNSELVLYSLQLVQAIKYESVNGEISGSVNVRQKAARGIGNHKSNARSPSLSTFLIERAVKNIELANYLYWFLKLELDDPFYGSRYREVFTSLRDRLSKIFLEDSKGAISAECQPSFTGVFDSVPNLGSSLTEASSSRRYSMSKSGYRMSVWDLLIAQDQFINGVIDCQGESREFRAKKDGKEQHLRKILKSKALETVNNGWAVPLPSAPHIMVTGVKPDTARMFKSGLYPALIEFNIRNSTEVVNNGNEKLSDEGQPSNPSLVSSSSSNSATSVKIIVKTGDDLRQDQLVIMLIKLMDRILKRGTLDLCLKPYPIMATSSTSGLVEFVEGSHPISEVLSKYNNSILQFFQKVAPCKDSKYGVKPDVMQRYIRSCAGYCVITYLIGVGDRHLDNIMLQPNGCFFHIDFGFIFGRDPKISVTTFRLTKEMIDAMGGQDSAEYRQFCSLACQAFNLLRKRAGLVLNLLHLMSDAGIEDLSNNPMADAEGVILKVEEKFRLELTDEQAESYFLGLINESLAALAPRLLEVFHQIAVARR